MGGTANITPMQLPGQHIIHKVLYVPYTHQAPPVNWTNPHRCQ